jgi:hypothetical protein
VKLVPLLEGHVEVAEPTPVGPAPTGFRLIVDILGGTFTGERLQGTILRSGADWALITPDGVSRLDLRFTLLTNDGVPIYVQLNGLLEVNAAVQSRGGSPTEFGQTYFMSQVRFECAGPSPYGWLNGRLAVGEGRLGPVAYRNASAAWLEFRWFLLEN